MSRTRRYPLDYRIRWPDGGAWEATTDRKVYFKPPKWFKRLMTRIRRAKDANALRAGREPERWRSTDSWDWN